MGFLTSLVFGFCTGISFVGGISWFQKKRSEDRMEKAKDIAALSRMDREDLKKLITSELMPSWCKFQTFEKVEWINKELKEIWPFVSKAASELIRAQVQEALNTAKPGILSKLEFDKFTLGTISPQFGGIKFVETPEDEVVIEIDIKWGGNPSIILHVQPVAFPTPIEVQVKDLMFFGNIKLMFKPLLDDLPCFGAIVVSLTEKPSLHFKLKFGGNEITAIPKLDGIIDGLIRDAIEAQLVWPSRIVVPIKPGDYEYLQMKDIGILDVKLVEAVGLLNTEILSASDPYAVLYVRPMPDHQFKSKTKDNELDPVWNEGFEIKVQDPSTQYLTVRILDKEVGADELIGEGRLELAGLLEKPGSLEDEWLTLYKNCEKPNEGKPRGKVHLEVIYRPYGPDGTPIVPPLVAQSMSYHDMNKATELEQILGNVSPDEVTTNVSTVSERRMFNRGVLMVKVIKATNLEAADFSSSTSDPYVQLWMKNKSESKQRTQVIYKELNPVWDEEFEFLVENPNDDMLMTEVYDHDMFGRRDFLGKLSLTLTRVMYHGQYSGEFQLVGAKQGSLTVEMQWNPVPV